MALLLYYIDTNLKELRKSKGLTQLEASSIVDIPLRSYKRLESDNKYLSTYKYKHAYGLIENYKSEDISITNKTISVVGMGYVGLSNAISWPNITRHMP